MTSLYQFYRNCFRSCQVQSQFCTDPRPLAVLIGPDPDQCLQGQVGPETNKGTLFHQLAHTQSADYHFNLASSGFSVIDLAHVSVDQG